MGHGTHPGVFLPGPKILWVDRVGPARSCSYRLDRAGEGEAGAGAEPGPTLPANPIRSMSDGELPTSFFAFVPHPSLPTGGGAARCREKALTTNDMSGVAFFMLLLPVRKKCGVHGQHISQEGESQVSQV